MTDSAGGAHFKYFIIGGGMTADAAMHGIRELDPTGSIGAISREKHPPYNRPPLTKGLWKGAPLSSIWRDAASCGVDLRLGRRVTRIVPGEHRIEVDGDAGCTYEKLLIATGGTPRELPFGGDDILYYRTLDDYERLRGLTEHVSQFAVIGGGFIGSEIAAALAINGKQVTITFPGDGIGAGMFPPELSQFLNGFYREKGVQVLTGEKVTRMDRPGGGFALTTESGKSIDAGAVIAGIGITPNVELAKAAGLKVEDGIIVDERLCASERDVFAAGDAANFYNPSLDRRMRVEHEDNANSMGKAAGRSMAGSGDGYHYLPFFYSDLFELGYEAVGDLDAKLEIVEDWKQPFREGVIFYLKEGHVRGVLLWNVRNQVDAARRLIAEPGPFNSKNLKGRLPEGA